MTKKILTAAGAVVALAAIIFCVHAIRTNDNSIIDVTEISDYEQTITETISAVSEFIDPAEPQPVTAEQTSADPGIAVPSAVTAAPSTTARTPESSTVKPAPSAPASTTAAAPKTTAAPASSTAASGTISNYEYSYAGFNPRYADLNVADWTLTLVNRDYILPEGFEPPELVRSVPSVSDSKLLDSRVAPHYNDMYQAAKKDGIILETVSGYRSYSLQRNNFENKISKYRNQGMSKIEATQKAATIILPPGTSEHNLGFAMDICSLEQSFENTAEFRWLKAHAEDYGFILRYTKEKQSVTKIIYEPWHWRYVGVENARKINASGLCLEEYLGKVS